MAIDLHLLGNTENAGRKLKWGEPACGYIQVPAKINVPVFDPDAEEHALALTTAIEDYVITPLHHRGLLGKTEVYHFGVPTLPGHRPPNVAEAMIMSLTKLRQYQEFIDDMVLDGMYRHWAEKKGLTL